MLAGRARGKQRYQCKDCGYNYTVAQKSNAKPEAVKRLALQLYLEGLGFRSIGRMLSVSHVAVYHWIKSFGANPDRLKSDEKIELVEIDEVHSYIGEKNCCWIRIAVDRLGKRLIGFTIGDRSADTE